MSHDRFVLIALAVVAMLATAALVVGIIALNTRMSFELPAVPTRGSVVNYVPLPDKTPDGRVVRT